MTPEDFFGDRPAALEVFTKVRAVLEEIGPVDVKVSKSQVAFRRDRGFAYLWLPGRYLRDPQAEVVLSLDLDHEVDSERFKEVVNPSGRHWIHHLELQGPDGIDDEVRDWLAEAAEGAGK